MTSLSPEIIAKYQPVIGLEVHVQLLTKTKAFCGCKNEYGGEPNTHVCPVCLGLPGALPVLNKQAVEFAVLAAKAIGCEIRETSIFSRKNYFYPDSPKGYQISQFDKPIAENGAIFVPDAAGANKRIGVTRLHMEEDAGKSIHDGFADSATRTYIDLNRRRGLRVPDEAEGNSAVHGRLRLQHGGGFATLRRECERHAEGRDGVRDQGGG
jgi:aspartyl-tRNA(Asn)/glutamyl-tRNA(Gln) amidotransferase subunit B